MKSARHRKFVVPQNPSFQSDSVINAKSACLIVAVACQTTLALADEPEWHRYLDKATALAAAGDKPLFVVFRCER